MAKHSRRSFQRREHSISAQPEQGHFYAALLSLLFHSEPVIANTGKVNFFAPEKLALTRGEIDR
jgi:hypothetical protein